MTTALIVDDDPAIRLLLYHFLAPEYLVLEADDGLTGVTLAQGYGPEIVLLNLDMPGIDGYETCRRLKALPSHRVPIVVIITSHTTAPEFTAAMLAGADDYIAKPINRFELLSRMKLHLRLRESAHRKAASESLCPFDSRDLQPHSQEMSDLQETTIFALAKLAERRDCDTGVHLSRIRDYTALIARTLRRESTYAMELNEAYVGELDRASLLHDIGKVGIPDSILTKPGRLTSEERLVMQRHTVIGWEVLNQAAAHSSQGAFLAAAAAIARSHHERWDGGGYPDGLAAEAIPLGARIVAVADVYDALTTERSYKSAWTPREACAEIIRHSGSQFDPVAVEAFRAAFDDIAKLRIRTGERSGQASLSQFTQALVEA